MSRFRFLQVALVAALAACSSAGPQAVAPTSARGTATSGAPSAVAVAPGTPLSSGPGPSPTALPGCLPLCVQPNLRRPGALPAGEARSRYFFGGQFAVTIPDTTWQSGEDSTGEYKVAQSDPDNADIEFWLDVYPVVDAPGFPAVAGYDGSARALVAWLVANPNVKVDHRGPVTIDGLQGEVIDFERSPQAKNVDADCPVEIRPCVALFRFPQWDGPFDLAGPFKSRLYAFDVSWDNTNHGFYAVVPTSTVSIFNTFIPGAAKIVEGANLPADVHQ